MTYESVNPSTGETIETFDTMDESDYDRILDLTRDAQEEWKGWSFEQRAEVLNQAADILRTNRDDYAEIMAREMGKPLDQGRAEAEKCAWVCEYYADNAAKMLEDDIRPSDATESFVTYQPLGIVFAVMPWNYPFWQVFRFAAPNLMAGNAGLLKHAPNVTQCALSIEKIFEELECPDNVFRTLLVSNDGAADIIGDERVQGVTLTGSTRAGRAVASEAGSNIKQTVLELGGSDPYLVLDDADLQQAISTCVTSRLLNSGQSCIAAKRFIVVSDHQPEFEDRIVENMKSKTMGDPFDENVDLGPQARFDLRDDLHDQVQRSVDAGATLRTGGNIPDRNGAFYPPTVLSDVESGMPAYKEEFFGPVATIITVDSEEEAIEVANDSPFGLGAAVFTEDTEKGKRIARDELEAGCTFVNAYVKSDPRLPFGGIKQSGIGRELSVEGIREFVNTKTVYVE